jgi:hypothetical protein
MAPRGPSKSHKALFMKEMLVGAVGIEFAVHPISPADSVALLFSAHLKCSEKHLVLWPRCGQELSP